MTDDSTRASLTALFLKGRSAAFIDALAQLLSAYDADIKALGVQVEAAAERGGAGGVASRSLPAKLADSPVNEQQDNLASPAPACDSLQNCRRSCSVSSEAYAAEHVLAKPVVPESIGRSSRNCSVEESREARYNSTSSSEHYQMHLRGLVSAESSDEPLTLRGFVGGMLFESLSATVLLLFCLVTALEMQREGLMLGYELGMPRYRDPSETGWPAFAQGLQALMYICSSLFMLEVIIRILAFRSDFFSSFWNNLDVAVVLSSALEIALANSINIRLVRLLRLFRLLRFARMARFVRKVESLFFLVEALKASFRVLTWSCLLLLVVQVMTAFFLTEILFYFYFPDESAPQKDRELVFMYFGSFSRSLLTTFEMAMGNWPVPARVLFEGVSEWFIILFVLHKMTVGYSVLGVINAVFVQETLSAATSNDLSMVLKKQRQMKQMSQKLTKLFRAADTSEDDRVSRQEFGEILQNYEVKLWLASMDYDAKDPDILFDLLDKDKGGDLSAEEFVKGMTALRGQARAMDLLLLADTISISRTDRDPGTGTLSIGSTCPDRL